MDTSSLHHQWWDLEHYNNKHNNKQQHKLGLGTLQFDPTSGAVSGVQGTGVAGFQPFLSAAETTLGGVSPMITAAASRTGPTAYQAFESPYQTAVRDATLAQFDEQAQMRQQGIRDQAASLGALGAVEQVFN